MKDSRVVFVHPNRRFNVEDARSFGRLVFLFENQRGIDHMNPGMVLRRLQEALDREDFDPENDFVAVTGSSVLLSLLMVVLGRRYGKIRLLIWDHRTESYVHRNAVPAA